MRTAARSCGALLARVWSARCESTSRPRRWARTGPGAAVERSLRDVEFGVLVGRMRGEAVERSLRIHRALALHRSRKRSRVVKRSLRRAPARRDTSLLQGRRAFSRNPPVPVSRDTWSVFAQPLQALHPRCITMQIDPVNDHRGPAEHLHWHRITMRREPVERPLRCLRSPAFGSRERPIPTCGAPLASPLHRSRSRHAKRLERSHHPARAPRARDAARRLPRC